jgi:GNAT superfamily N-acetyltransferase
MTPPLDVRPVTPDRWGDLERLFGPSGAYSGCWCMFPRITAAEFAANGNAGNRAAMQAIVADGRVPGLLGYRDGEPVGWVSVAPRAEYGRVERSRLTGPRDDEPPAASTFAVVCFFIARGHRSTGVARALLEAAVAHAARHGATAVEGYPVDPGERRIPAADGWHGTLAMFEAAGFAEVERRSPARPIVRRAVAPPGERPA